MVELNSGDCGSWVVDNVTHEVYGHVIASDILGDAYVVPLNATFQHMKEQFLAESVELPTLSDDNWFKQHTKASIASSVPSSFQHGVEFRVQDKTNSPSVTDANGEGGASRNAPSMLSRSAQDWEEQRSILKQLYFIENRTLGEVMELMKTDYGFRATYARLLFSAFPPITA